jgi:hypothetical protein
MTEPTHIDGPAAPEGYGRRTFIMQVNLPHDDDGQAFMQGLVDQISWEDSSFQPSIVSRGWGTVKYEVRYTTDGVGPALTHIVLNASLDADVENRLYFIERELRRILPHITASTVVKITSLRRKPPLGVTPSVTRVENPMVTPPPSGHLAGYIADAETDKPTPLDKED